jgi:hypothetical protein
MSIVLAKVLRSKDKFSSTMLELSTVKSLTIEQFDQGSYISNFYVTFVMLGSRSVKIAPKLRSNSLLLES